MSLNCTCVRYHYWLWHGVYHIVRFHIKYLSDWSLCLDWWGTLSWMQGIDFVFRAICHEICIEHEGFRKMWLSKWHTHWFRKHTPIHSAPVCVFELRFDVVNKSFETPHSICYFQKHLRFFFGAKHAPKSRLRVHTHVHYQLTFLSKTIKYENKTEQLHRTRSECQFRVHSFSNNWVRRTREELKWDRVNESARLPMRNRKCTTKSCREFGRFLSSFCTALLLNGRLAYIVVFPLSCRSKTGKLYIVSDSIAHWKFFHWFSNHRNVSALTFSKIQPKTHTQQIKTRTKRRQNENAAFVCRLKWKAMVWWLVREHTRHTTIIRPENRSK